MSKTSEPEVLGENVLPRKFLSPPGERGGVCIYELFGECGVAIFEIKMGDGGAVSDELGCGFPISVSNMLTSLSVVPMLSHFMKSWSIWPLAIW